MDNLKNCPFCGKKAIVKGAKYNTLGMYGNSETEKYWYAVYCPKCGVGQPKKTYFSKDDAVEAWNKRTEAERLSGWISVKDRTPCEASNKWCVGVNSCGKMFAFKESLACNPKSDTWLIPTALFNAEEITHFMYLPEPPEEGNEDDQP